MKIEVGSGGIQRFSYLIIVSAWDQHELVGDRIFLDDIAFEILRPDQCGGSSLKRYAHDGYCFFLGIDDEPAFMGYIGQRNVFLWLPVEVKH